MGRERIRVLIADDDAGVRSALASLIESEADLELAAAAADAAQAVELAASEQPDVALIDLRMPAGGGVAAVPGIAAVSPRTKMIAMTASGFLPKVLEPRVVACLPKGGSIDEIVGTVRRAADGQPALGVQLG